MVIDPIDKPETFFLFWCLSHDSKTMNHRQSKENLAAVIKALRQRRLDLEYTQEYVAAQVGCSQNSYSKIELGRSYITLERFFAICDILSIAPEVVLHSAIAT